MEKGKKEKKHEPRGRSSKRVGTKLKDWRAGRWSDHPDGWSKTEQLRQIEQKRVEAVDINGSILSYHFVRYSASSSMKW